MSSVSASPFDGTPFANREWREGKLREVGSAFERQARQVHRFNSSRSVVIAGREKGHALVRADRDLFEAARQLILRERAACAAAAGAVSAEAAAAVLSRPLPDAWEAPQGFTYLARGAS